MGTPPEVGKTLNNMEDHKTQARAEEIDRKAKDNRVHPGGTTGSLAAECSGS
jgi:hypothetical protein